MDKEQFDKIDCNQTLIMILIGLIAIIMLTQSVHAQTITMSNPGASNSRDIMVYYPNSSLQGFYNDTSVITLDANESYIFVLKPLSSNPLTDPTDWMNNQAIPWVQTNVTALIAMAVIVSIAIVGLRK
jgi:hypothetical protein